MAGPVARRSVDRRAPVILGLLILSAIAVACGIAALLVREDA
jgi:hypothetical protein